MARKTGPALALHFISKWSAGLAQRTLYFKKKVAVAEQNLAVLTAWHQFNKNWWTGRELNP